MAVTKSTTDWTPIRCHACNKVLFECSASETSGPIRIICSRCERGNHRKKRLVLVLPLKIRGSEVRTRRLEK